MPRREAFPDRSTQLDYELGLWIQRSLEESVLGKEPGESVWRRIKRRVEEHVQPAGAHCVCGGSSSPLTHLVQAMVVSTLLLTFAFGANHDVVMPSGAHLVAESPAVQPSSSFGMFEEDMLQGYKLVRMERAMLARRGGYIQGTRCRR
jgi:hypothetical protein